MVADGPRYTRRTSDHVLIAFHQACDQRDFEVAELLLKVLESVFSQGRLPPAGADRRVKEAVVAAYERLWQLRNADPVNPRIGP
jgi:hypothetical protein